jgi:YqiJ-like protein
MFLWVNAGRLPLLILLILALGLFSIAGFFLQGLAHGAGLSIPALVAALAAAAVSLPAIRVTSRGIARIIPRDETYVVDEADFVGHVAEVSIGPLDQGLPGKVRLKDVFGNWHSVAARASPESTPLPVGASVLLVDRDARSFIAISAPADLIAQQQTSRRA